MKIFKITVSALMYQLPIKSRNVHDLAAHLCLVSQALDLCQSDKCGIADACHEWLLLSDPVFQPHIKLIENHIKWAVLIEHLAAYLLHPYKEVPV